MKPPVRLGIIGLGGMGQHHARYLLRGDVQRVKLVAAADSDPARLAAMPGLTGFASGEALINSGAVDAVLIATPHYAHVPVGIAALKAGLHVLVEKPIAVDKAGAVKLIAAHTRRKQVFGAMFNLRTDPRYQKLREMVRGGELGPVRRVALTATDSFRPNAYYADGGWRATWAGEGGGVLINQCVHNLDLLQWIFGQPERVRGFCKFGRYHPIEVEDDVTAYLEFANGCTATFIASTGEAPGVNRLEVTADNGRVILEAGQFRFTRNKVPAGELARTSQDKFLPPATEEVDMKGIDGAARQHMGITQNFVDAILDGVPLIAPAKEGLNSVELINAMLLSTWTDDTVKLPMSAAVYARWLKKKVARSKR